MSPDAPQILLPSSQDAEAADLPAEYEKLARQCAAEGWIMSSSSPGWSSWN
jgi:hypothetical protein